MPIITLCDVGVQSPRPLFEHINLTLQPSCRLGIVAPNGCGKTTLLHCIARKIEPQMGAVIAGRGVRIGYVEQDLSACCKEQTLFDFLCSGLADSAEDWRVWAVLNDFGIPADQGNRALQALSGGQQKMAMLARAAVGGPDVLLLDEPTNHLDLSKIRLLEKWIQRDLGACGLIVVSHDRYFLDQCTTQTLFLRPLESKLYDHAYSAARRLLDQDDAAQASAVAQDQKEARRLYRSAMELKNIGINCRCDAAQKKAKQMKERADRIESAQRPLHRERSADVRLATQMARARLLLACDDRWIYAPDGRALFRTGAIKLYHGDRIVVLGSNGAGKSMLLRSIHDALAMPDHDPGVFISPQAVIAYADQHMSHLPDDASPFDLVASRFSLGDARICALLAGAGFPAARQHQRLSQFSSGQRIRLGFLILRLQRPHLYILDEPTNHLDIAGQEQFESDLVSQNASCLVVSHDRAFVRNIGTRFLQIDGKCLIERDAPAP